MLVRDDLMVGNLVVDKLLDTKASCQPRKSMAAYSEREVDLDTGWANANRSAKPRLDGIGGDVDR